MRKVPQWPLVLAIAAFAAVVLLTAPWRGLFEPDESRYAEVAREMLSEGQWLVPHLNGEPYTHKPPLYLWLLAVLRSLGFSWTLAGVLPSAIALVGMVLLLPALARSLGLLPGAGQLGAALLVGMPLVAVMGAVARMDMPLAFFHTLAVLALARLLGAGTVPCSQQTAHLLLWLAIGLGVLTKGPLALALPVVTALVYAAAVPDRVSLRPLWRGWGPALAVAVVLLWLVPAGLVGGSEYLREITIRQSAGRIVGSFAHREPFYFHLATYPLTGLPASPLALIGAFLALRRRARGGPLLLASALVAVLAFFTVISGKLVIYLLPLFPVAALLAADTLLEKRRGSKIAAHLGAVGLILLGVALGAAPYLREQFLASRTLLLVAGSVVAAAGLAALVHGLHAASARAPGLGLALAGLLTSLTLVPAVTRVLAPVMTTRDVGAAVQRAEPAATEVVAFRDYWAGLSLYGERTVRVIEDEGTLAAYLASGRVAVLQEKDWKELAPVLTPVVSRAERIPHRRSGLWLVIGATASRPAT